MKGLILIEKLVIENCESKRPEPFGDGGGGGGGGGGVVVVVGGLLSNTRRVHFSI